MASRAAALAGLRYFTAIRPIAERVGVVVPSDVDIARRFAGTDDIDLAALTSDAVMLTGVVTSVSGAVDAAHDLHATLPDAWRGRVADAADAAVADHLTNADEAVDRIRAVSRTVTAAAGALSRVQAEKYRTLSCLQNDHVAGQPISSISPEDVDAGAAAICDEVSSALGVFARTMDTVDEAVSVILTALTDSFAELPDPVVHSPGNELSGIVTAPPAASSRPRVRTDIVTGSAAMSQTDHTVVDTYAVAASTTATIAGAALAAASVVGMAAATGLGSILSHLVEGADTPDDQTDSRGTGSNERAQITHGAQIADTAPDTGSSADVGAPDVGGADVGRADQRSATTDSVTGGRFTEFRPDEGRADGSGRAPLLQGDRAPAVPGSAERSTDGPGPDGIGLPGAAARGSRTDRGVAPTARPDPDDAGGLALVGER